MAGSGGRASATGVRSSLRFRLTALATLLVGVVIAASALGVVVLQRAQLITDLDRSLEQRADAATAAVEDDLSSEVLPAAGEDRAAQVVATDGTVLAATPNLTGRPPIATSPDADDRQTVSTRELAFDDGTYRVLTRRIDTASGPAVVHVVEESDDVLSPVSVLAWTLGGAVPVAIALFAALIWWLVGRTLRPVEAIRSEVDEIGGTDLDRRVPIPAREDEIARLATTMNLMLERISSAVERQRRFVADASHELRTPITRIRTEVEVDLDQPDRADPDATRRSVLREAEDLEHLIEDLLHLARSDAGAAPWRRLPVDLDDIVLQEVIRQRAEAPDGITIDVRRVSAAHLLGDTHQLTRAVRNLLSNAARHATSSIEVSLAEHEREARLTVGDDGPGVPAEARDRIFERFSRVDDARTRASGGTGLGLAIVRDIVEQHGGTIAYDPSGSPGARFVVTLPIAPDAP